MHDSHERGLKALEARGRLRALSPRRGIDFSSNDYLGLAASGALNGAIEQAIARGVPMGAGGSRLLRGNDPEHEALEADAARHFGGETALYFASGFMANYAVFSTLPQRGDLIVYDALIHASAHDGMRASKAEAQSAAHNDAQSFDDAITTWRAGGGTGQIWIALESLYSMEGDFAPIEALAQVAAKHDAMLVIDEAHASGVYGEAGRGLAESLEGQPNVLTLHTCGKALGVMGALLVMPKVLRDYMVNRSRPFIYATAPSPLMAAAVRASIALNTHEPQRRETLHARITLANERLAALCGMTGSGSQIIPVIVGTDARATALAATLQAKGFDVRAVRPPTVPEGTARLRISITINASDDDVRSLFAALAGELERLAA